MDTNIKLSKHQEKLMTYYKASLGKAWAESLKETLLSEEMESSRKKIVARRKLCHVFPKSEDVFRAFKLCPLEETRVVIIGQDPYHTPGHANGLAFSSSHPSSTPPSLRNILREIVEDCYNGADVYEDLSSDLTYLAKQGVLLMNTAFTVEKGKPGSHSKLWTSFTEKVVKVLAEKPSLVFVLWGKHAQRYKKFLNANNIVLETSHPSPFSAHAGFFGCKHFSKINNILEGQNGNEFKIKWLNNE